MGIRIKDTEATLRDWEARGLVAPAPGPAPRHAAAGFVAVVPIRTYSSNRREHWGAKSRRVRAEHEAVRLALAPYDWQRESLAESGAAVGLTRCGRGSLDGDNLGGALKAVRDAVAMWLLGGKPGQRDSDPRIEWNYGQVRLPDYRVMISVRPKQ